MKRRIACFLLGLFFISACAIAQETTFYKESERLFNEGKEQYDLKNYAAARFKFEQYLDLPDTYFPSKQNFKLANIRYFIAHSALELFQPDAEKLLLDFVDDFPHVGEKHLAYSDLGRLKYRERKFREAIEWFEKADERFLTSDILAEQKFQQAYSYFTIKQLDKAESLFNETRIIANKYYYPSNYYYGYIAFYNKNYDDAKTSFEKIEDSELFQDELPYFLNQIYFLKGDYDKVIVSINSVLESEKLKYGAELTLLLGQAYYEKKKYSEAEEHLENYITNAKNYNKEDVYRLGITKYKVGKFQDAATYLEQLNVLKDSLGQFAMIALGDTYLKLKRKSDARNAFQTASLLNFNQQIREESLFNYGKLSLELGFYSEAVKSLSDFGIDYPTSAYRQESFELLTDALLQSKNYKKAIELIEQSDIKNKKITGVYQKVCYLRAAELFNDGDLTSAMVLTEKSINTQADKAYTALAHFLQGDINYQQQRFPLAVESYSQFINLSAIAGFTDKSEPNLLRGYYNLAYSYFKQDKFSSALTNYQAALKQKRFTETHQRLYKDALIRSADCAFLTKNYALAITEYDRIITDDKSNAAYAYLQKALIYGLQGKFSAKVDALTQMAVAFKESRYRDRAIFEKAVTLQEDLNDLNAAILTYNQLIAEHPESSLRPEAMQRKGLIYVNLEQNQDAINTYKQVVREYPNTEVSREVMPVLREVYVIIGDPDGYFTFVNSVSGLSVSVSEQDSVLYESAQVFYNNGNCQKSIEAFTKYLNQFPKGTFALEALFKRAECLYNGENWLFALEDYDKVAAYPTNKYTENAINKAAWIAYFKKNDYTQALRLFQHLQNVASNPDTRQRALVGQLRAHFQLNQHNLVIEYADKVLASPQTSSLEALEAKYYSGLSYLSNGESESALPLLESVAANTNSEKGAEAAFLVAEMYYDEGLYAESKKRCLALRDKFGSYEIWVVKAFILLSDNYAAEKNIPQAKATLESILMNFKGNQSLIDEAQQKYDALEEIERDASKIDNLQSPSDSMIFRE